MQSVTISIAIKTQFALIQKDFKTVQELAKYLEENTEVAKLVEYVPKQKKPGPK